MSYQHVRPRLTGGGEQRVQIFRSGDAVLRVRGALAPPLSGAVVCAYAGALGHRAGDPSPGGGDLAHTVGENDGGTLAAVAVQVQPVAADVVELPRCCVGVLVADQRDVLVGGADGAQCQDSDDRGQQPTCGTGGGTTHCVNIQTARTATTGGHTQLSRVMAS